ncbi:hypothetical protein BDV98DRAFT_583567 [Pterulicium gracile]|uniref:Uncharacterized protein n=1 Tax=Pterulicium gracile TaxID=1884261 RepID=A0A5C3QE28_9AGAR|nr:hypothetical protein BDV98DRAFT_583567 [Pterula gracilis]
MHNNVSPRRRWLEEKMRTLVSGEAISQIEAAPVIMGTGGVETKNNTTSGKNFHCCPTFHHRHRRVQALRAGLASKKKIIPGNESSENEAGKIAHHHTTYAVSTRTTKPHEETKEAKNWVTLHEGEIQTVPMQSVTQPRAQKSVRLWLAPVVGDEYTCCHYPSRCLCHAFLLRAVQIWAFSHDPSSVSIFRLHTDLPDSVPNTHPGDAACKTVKAELELAQSRLSTLNAAIRRLTSQRDHISRTFIAHRRSVLSPIARVPDNILLNIFELYLQAGANDRPNSKALSPHPVHTLRGRTPLAFVDAVTTGSGPSFQSGQPSCKSTSIESFSAPDATSKN